MAKICIALTSVLDHNIITNAMDAMQWLEKFSNPKLPVPSIITRVQLPQEVPLPLSVKSNTPCVQVV